MSTRMLNALALVGALAAAAPCGVAAQSVPGALAKRAAQNAVDATNAHTAAMQAPTSDAPAPAPAPAKPVRAAAAAAAASVPSGTAPTKAAPIATVPTKGTAVVAKTPPAASPSSVPATTKQQQQQQQPAVSAAKGAAAPPAAAAAAAAAGSPSYAARSKSDAGGPGTPTVAVTERGGEGQLTFQRETFDYAGRGRRDPFVSLIKSGEIRPLFGDLKLVTVLYDPTGRNSVAIMHDVSTKEQYRVKVGQTLGRMRVSQIQPKQVVFAIEEFGYGRQAVLALNDSTKARKQ